MARKKVHARISTDALELLEYIAADGPFHSLAELRALTDDNERRWKMERVTRAVDELFAAERITRDRDGLVRAVDDGFCSATTTIDDELGVRVRVMTAIYAANESIDFGVTLPGREDCDLASDLGDAVVARLRRANGLPAKGPGARR